MSGPQDELNRIQAKIDYLQGKHTMDMQEVFDMHNLMFRAAFLRLDNHSAKIRDLEEEVKTLKEKNHAGE